MSSRTGKIYFSETLAGTIEQTDGNYIFTYDKIYLKSSNPRPISLTLSLREEPYVSKTMIAFFDGLIPEGWLLDIAARNWKLNVRDRMSLLLTLCRDCLGAVSVIGPENEVSDAQDK